MKSRARPVQYFSDDYLARCREMQRLMKAWLGQDEAAGGEGR